MKNIFLLIVAFATTTFMFSCETKQDFIDSEKVAGYYDMSMMDLMKRDSYNWDSTLLVIEKAELTDLFEGTDPDHPQITFMGFTNLSIIRYLFDTYKLDENGHPIKDLTYEGDDFEYKYLKCSKIDDVPAETWRELVLKHVVDGKHKVKNIPFGTKIPKEGGKEFKTLSDNIVWFYKYHQTFNDVPEAGPIVLYLESITAESKISIASSDIECNNGVIHSLHYDYVFGEI